MDLSLKTLGQAYIALDDFFKTAEEQKWILTGINCSVTSLYKLKYILLVEKDKADGLDHYIEQDELEEFTQAIVSEFQATLEEADVYTSTSWISREGTIGMIEIITA